LLKNWVEPANAGRRIAHIEGLLDGSVVPGKARKENGDECVGVRVDPLRIAGIAAREKTHLRSGDIWL
jgi:hypothetical protein